MQLTMHIADLKALVLKRGGLTVEANTLRPVERDNGFAVASHGFDMSIAEFTSNWPTPALFDTGLEFIGFWVNGGRVHIEAVQIVASIGHAVTLAKNFNQRAIYSFEAKACLYMEPCK